MLNIFLNRLRDVFFLFNFLKRPVTTIPLNQEVLLKEKESNQAVLASQKKGKNLSHNPFADWNISPTLLYC